MVIQFVAESEENITEEQFNNSSNYNQQTVTANMQDRTTVIKLSLELF